MANGGQVTYGINFNVDQSGLQQAKKALQDIQKMSMKDMHLIDPSITAKDFSEIRQQASELQSVLSKSFNSTLGTWNLQTLQASVNKIDLNKAYNSLGRLGSQGKTAFREMSIEAMTASNQIQKTTGFLDKMGQTMINTVKWGVASRIMNEMAGSVQQAYGYVKSLDTSLNDIRIVTGKSADEMDRFAIQANKAAQELGKSTTDYTNASLIYYQQGLSDEEVKARTETTLKAASVTGQDTAAVSEQLTAVWNGFKVGAEESELAVDKLAAVAATTASDLEELATGMSKVSSAASAMGVTEDQLAATLSTIISVTRDAPESVGTAMKTIYARMGDLKVDGVDEFGTKLGDVTTQMETMGIQVLDQQGNFRDMGTIIEEVGDKWDGWTRAQQQAAAVALAGKRQYNNLIALFDNWDQYTQALNTSMTAQGTLEEQNGIYLESLAAKTEQYHAALENLEDSLLDSDSFKTMLEGITGITNGLATFVDAIGGGGSAILGLGAIITQVFNKQIASELTNFTKNFTNTVNNLDESKARAKVQQQFGLADENDDVLKEVSKNAQKLETSGVATTEDWENLKNLSLEYEKAQTAADNFKKETEQVEAQLKELGVTDSLDELAEGFQHSDDGVQELENHIRELLRINDLKNLENSLKNIDEEADKGAASVRKIVNELKQVGEENPQIQELIQLLQEAQFEDTPDEYGIFHIDPDQLELIRQKAQEVKDDVTTQIDVATQASEDAVNVIQQDGQQIQDTAEQSKKALNDFGNNFGDVTKAQEFLKCLQGIQSVAFGLMSFNNVFDIIKDKDLSNGEKLLQTLLALGSAVPMVVTGMQKLSSGISALGLTDALDALSINPVIAILTGIVVVGVVVAKVFDALTVSAEEAAEALDEANQEFEQTQSELDSLKGELETTAQRIDELLSKDSLTIIEQNELDKLQSANDLLERQIELKERELAVDAKDRADAGDTSFKKERYGTGSVEAVENTKEGWKLAQQNSYGTMGDFVPTYTAKQISSTAAAIAQYQVLNEEIEKQIAIQEQADQSTKEGAKAYEDAEKAIEKYKVGQNEAEKYINNAEEAILNQIQALKDWQDLSPDTFGDKQQKELEQYQEYLDNIQQQMEPEKWQANQLDKIMGLDQFKDKFDKGIEEYKKLADSNDLKTLLGDDFSDFQAQLQAAGLSVDDFIGVYNDIIDEALNSAEELNIATSQAVERFNTLNGVQDDLSDDYHLSADNYNKLSEFDGLQEFFTLAADGTYKLLGDAEEFYRKLNELKIDGFISAMDKVQNELDSLSQGIGGYNSFASLSSNAHQYNGTGVGYTDNIDKANDQIDYVRDYGDGQFDTTQINEWREAIKAGGEEAVAAMNEVSDAVKQVGDKGFNSLKEQEKKLEKESEDLKNALEEALDPLDEDVDPKQFKELADYIQDAAGESEDFSKDLKKNRRATEDVSEAILRFDHACEDMIDNYEEYKDALQDGNKTAQDTINITNKLANNYGDLLDIDGSMLSQGFLESTENLEDLERAINGDIDAYERLREAAMQDILTTIAVDDSQLQQLQSDYDYIQDYMNNNDILVGADIDDEQFLAACQEIVDAAVAAGLNAEDALMAAGVNVELQPIEGETVDTKEAVGWDATPDEVQLSGSVPNIQTSENGGVEVGENISLSGSFPIVHVNPQPMTETETKTTTGTAMKVVGAHKAAGGGTKFNNASHGGGGAGRAARSGGGRGGSGGGGGGGKDNRKVGKKASKAHKKDKYHDLNNNLKQFNHQLKMQNQLEEQLVGNALVKKLEEEDKSYVRLIKNAKNFIKTQNEDLKTRQKKLKKDTKIKIKFEADGQIDEKQYNKVINKYQKKYNKLVKQYNKVRKGTDGKGLSSEDQEAWDKKLEKAEKKLENVKKKLDKYDEIYEQKLEKIEELQELYYARLEKKLQVYTTKLQNIVDKWNHKIEEHTDALKRLEHQMNSLQTAQDHLTGAAYTQNLADQNKLIQKQLTLLKQQQKNAQSQVKDLQTEMKNGYKITWNEVNPKTGKVKKKPLENTIKFKFDNEGNISNSAELLKNAKTQAEREAIQEAINKYYDSVESLYDYIEQRQELAYQKLANDLEIITSQIDTIADKASDAIAQLEAQLKLLELRLNRLQRAQEKLVGQRYIEGLKRQNTELTKQYNNYKKQSEAAKTALADMQNQMALQHSFSWKEVQADGTEKTKTGSIAFKFDEDGNITNGANLLKAAKTAEEREAIQAMIDQYNGKLDEWISAQEGMDDVLEQIAENRIAAFEYKITVQFEFNDLQDAWNDFRRSYILTWDNETKRWIDDTTQAGLLAISQGIADSAQAYVDRFGTNTSEGLQATFKQANEEWLKASDTSRADYGTGVYGTNAQAALENFKSVEEQMRNTITNALEAAKQAHEYFLKSIDLAAQEFDKQKGYLEAINNFTQHNIKVTQLAYGKNSTQLNKYYEKLGKNYQQQATLAQKEAAMWKQRMDQAEKGSDEWQKYYDNWLAATQEANTALENQMQNVLDQINLKIEQTYANLAKLSDGTTVSETSEMWQKQLSNADKYLDTINKAYDIEQLRSKFIDSINSLDGNVKAQERLNALMDDQISQLEQSGQLRQYDVDRAEKLYNIALKQIALEEAQQNKSKMRLQRDSQGNYTYRYVADTDAVNKAQQELNTAQQDLYNTDKKQRETDISEYYSTYNEMLNKLKQLDTDYANGTITDENEYNRLREFYQNQYNDRLIKLQTDLATVTDNLNQSTLISMQSLYIQGAEAASDFQLAVSNEWNLMYNKASDVIDGIDKQTFDTFMNTTVPNYQTGTQMIGTAFEEMNVNKIKPALDAIEKDTKEVREELEEYATEINDDAIEAVEDLIVDVDTLVDSTNDSIDATQAIDIQMQDLASTIQSQLVPAWEKATRAMSEYYEAAASYIGEDIGTGGLNITANPETGEMTSTGMESTPGNQVTDETTAKNNALSKAKAAYKSLRISHGPDLRGPNGETGKNITRGEAWTILTPLNEIKEYSKKNLKSKYGISIGTANKNKVNISDKNLLGIKKLVQDLGWYDYGFATGGYTGDWAGEDGKLALLHQKEIVLNKDDTKNFLAAIEITRAIADKISGLAYETQSANFSAAQGNTSNSTTATSVTIYADFPAVNKASEIEVAFNNLKARASQVAGKS